jgi:hypothetical protein
MVAPVALRLAHQLRQLRHVGRDPSRLVQRPRYVFQASSRILYRASPSHSACASCFLKSSRRTDFSSGVSVLPRLTFSSNMSSTRFSKSGDRSGISRQRAFQVGFGSIRTRKNASCKGRSNRGTMTVSGYVRPCHSWRSHIPPIMKRFRFVSIDALCQDRPLRLCQVEGNAGRRTKSEGFGRVSCG